MLNIAIILSGGVGSRLGADIPKQYIEVDKKTILQYCIETFLNTEAINSVIIVVADEWKQYVVNMIDALNPSKPIFYAKSGETRQYSIYNALKEAKLQGARNDDIVIIHDAARPLVSQDLIERCLDGCSEADGVLPVIHVKDTLYHSIDGVHITNLLNRHELFAGQAPEAFLFGKYLKLHDQIPRQELLRINGSTEIAYKGGLKVKLITGDEMNFKITTLEDLTNFEGIIKNRK